MNKQKRSFGHRYLLANADINGVKMGGRLILAGKSKYCKKSVSIVHYFFASLLFFFLSVNLFAQDLDLRNDCTGFTCNATNITILQVFLSTSDGTPLSSDFCNDPGISPDVFVSIKYSTQQNKSSYNARLFGDLVIGETTTFLNYFIGEIEPAQGIEKTIVLNNYPIKWTCGQQVNISSPLIAWTPNPSNITSYDCNSYPSDHCQFPDDFIVNTPLSVDFDYVICTNGNVTTVNLFSKVSGGVPPYIYIWQPIMTIGLNKFQEANPTFTLNEDVKDIELTIEDDNETIIRVKKQIVRPAEISISGSIIHPSSNQSDGSINLTLSGGTGDLSVVWEDGSMDRLRTGLPAGIYNVSVTDAMGCIKSKTFILAAISLEKTADLESYSSVGEVITYVDRQHKVDISVT